MKYSIKWFFMSICSATLLVHSHLALSDTSSDTETLLNWAETTYPNLFPSRQATQSIEPWLFRYYPESGVYAGVNKNDNGVYALGGVWGNTPTFIDELANLTALIANSGGGGNKTSCDTSNTIPGIDYRQSGNVITVTSNGQCLLLPDLTTGNTLCETPQQSTASGISMLSANTVTASSLKGLTSEVPGLPDTFKAIVESTASTKHCTVNAPADAVSLVVNSDLCFDITSALSSTLGSLPVEGLVITPPITYAFTGTYTSEIVNDCFATDAASIHDALTGENWIRKNNAFIKVNH